MILLGALRGFSPYFIDTLASNNFQQDAVMINAFDTDGTESDDDDEWEA